MTRFFAPVLALLFATAAHAQSGLVPANQVWAGPPSGGEGFARARALVSADLPALSFGSFSLASGQIAVGQASGFAGAVAMSGDCTIIASGAITCTKTSGTTFAAVAKTGSAADLTTGTLPNARLVAVPNSSLNTPATTVAGQTCTLGSTCGLSSLTNSISVNVALNNTSNYFDGPSVAQGTTGTWFASGTVGIFSSTADNIACKLWDGTTAVAIGSRVIGAGNVDFIALSGVFTSPAANIRVSCKDLATTSGQIVSTGDGSVVKASTVTVFRIN